MTTKIRKEAITAKTSKQKELMAAIRNFPVVLAVGPAGTGKTFVAANVLSELFDGNSLYDKIVVARPNVSTGRSLGFFPGDLLEKLENWLAPILSTLRSIYGKGRVTTMIRSGAIVLQPVETIRGQSFENALIFIDEAQNLTKDELIAIMTRLGRNSKMVLAGDPAQTDIRDHGYQWLADFLVKNRLDAAVVTFNADDIVRSDFVGSFIRALNKQGK